MTAPVPQGDRWTDPRRPDRLADRPGAHGVG